jgi:hypothetical protein
MALEGNAKERRSFLSLIVIMSPGCVGQTLPTLPRTLRLVIRCVRRTIQIPGNGNVDKLTSEIARRHKLVWFSISRMMTNLFFIILGGPGDAKWMGVMECMEAPLLNCCSTA